MQVIDRMAGPGTINGTIGKKDGRIDFFLEEGEYEIVTTSHEKAEGDVFVSAVMSKDKNKNRPKQLVLLKPITTTLNDFETVSYWMEIKQRQRVTLEAADRNLTDLRILKEGGWLLDFYLDKKVIEPEEGKPMATSLLSVILDP